MTDTELVIPRTLADQTKTPRLMGLAQLAELMRVRSALERIADAVEHKEKSNGDD